MKYLITHPFFHDLMSSHMPIELILSLKSFSADSTSFETLLPMFDKISKNIELLITPWPATQHSLLSVAMHELDMTSQVLSIPENKMNH